MSNSARMTKGFRRIGIVLAVPLFAVAVLIVGFGAAVEAVHYFERAPAKASAVTPRTESRSMLSNETVAQMLQDGIDGKFAEPAPIESKVQGPAWTILLFLSAGLATIAGLIYLACWSVGWIYAGFSID
jgi:hypothetical protein